MRYAAARGGQTTILKKWKQAENAVEKFFRTSKQSLGVKDCQSTSVEKQRAHIFATFVAFTELENQKIFKKKKSPVYPCWEA